MADIMIPGGSKGAPKVSIAQATDGQLSGFVKWARKKLQEEPNSRYAESNRRQIAAAEAEIERRAKGGKREPTATEVSQSHAIERAQQTSLAGPDAAKATLSLEKAIHNPAVVSARLRELAEAFHLVTPVTSVDALPPGCGVSISYVTVNADASSGGPKEVYSVGDRLGLSGDTLKRIAAAAGVDWDPLQSGRLDDGSDPHYCHYRAVGHVRSFDGSLRTLTGEVEIDARDTSPQIEEIITKAKNATDRNGQPKPRDPGPQILELRKFLLRHAESKAKNRAIADMGVKRSYAPAELTKAFAVARIVWTGQTDDPTLRREFARMHAERMMDGAAALYGRHQPSLPQARPAPHALPELRGHAPPPAGSGGFDAFDYEPDADYDTDGAEVADAAAAAATAPASTLPADQDRGPNPEAY
jgi:hypothetical protein